MRFGKAHWGMHKQGCGSDDNNNRRGGFGGGGFAGGFGRGFPGGGFGGPEGGRGGRRRKMFDPGELQLLLLAQIAEEPRHGYELIRAIEAKSGGGYAPSPGVVYPALTYMEEAGQIAVAPEEISRKTYAITEAGRAHIDENKDAIAQAERRLAAMAEQSERIDIAPLRRAMHNVKHAVFERVANQGVDKDLINTVVDILDDAARRIERS